MIKLKVYQILQCAPALQHLATQPFKGSVAFRVRRLIHALQPEIASASAARDSLITDSNSKKLESGSRQVNDADIAAFLADPLFEEEIEIDVDPLPISDIQDISISPEYVDFLMPLLKE